jgi:hypothetical protein
MFMLYAVVFGVLCGYALRGNLDGLTEVRIRWPYVALAGFLAQVLLFSTPLTALVGDNGAIAFVASASAVFVVVVRNWRIRGLPIVAVGAASNLLAIVTNGGWMPASRGALESLGKVIGPEYTNSREFTSPALPFLTDIFALPRWVPFTNVFSVGDVIIGVGIFVAIVAAMRLRPLGSPPVTLVPAPDAVGRRR